MDDQDDHPDGSEPMHNPITTKTRRNNNRSKAASTAGGPVRQKGKRGPSRTSCAECRRLKLKCDGTVPCAQCVKRGYGAICPDGTHRTGHGHRLFWNNTAEMRNKISEFSERIRQLEEALKSAYSVVSHEEHPLLSEDHLQIKEGISLPADVRPRNPPSGIPMSTEEEESKPDIAALDRFGSLSISPSGGSRFFGHAASPWWFMHNEEPEEVEDESALYPLFQLLPPEILAQTGTYPLSLVSPPYSHNQEDHLRTLIESVPPEDETKELVDCAFRYAFFMYRPITYEQYLSTVHEHVYLLHPDTDGLEIHASGLLCARLAVLFMLLAIGTHVSRETRQFEPDAERYHQLGRASLMRSRLVEDPSIEGIQALMLTSLYMNLRGTAASDNSNMRWLLGGLVTKLSHEMGLHIDPSRYGLSEMEIQRRRVLFREIFMYDLGQAFAFCRPPSISSGYCDIQFQTDMTTATETDFDLWKYKLGFECLSSIHAQAYGASPPNHATVLALTRRVEQYPMWSPSDEEQPDTERNHAERVLQQHFSRMTIQEILLYLHRPFFAIATDKFKDDPLGCEYGTSVIAAYRSAHQIVSLMHYMHTHAEHPSNRIWFIWANLFGSAVILGGLVVRCPHIPFAKDAYDQLRLACDLFSRVKDAFNANKVYDKMIKTRDLAHKALHEFATRDQPDRGSTPPISPTEDLLNKFGGKTRTISRPEVTSSGSGSGSTGGSAGAGSPMGSRGGSAPVELPVGKQLAVPLPLSDNNGVGYHPTVVAYLKTLPPSTHVHGFEASKVPAWGTPPPVSTPLSARSRSHTLPPILEGESLAHSPEASASHSGRQRTDVSVDSHLRERSTLASPVSATYSDSSGLHQRSHTAPHLTSQARLAYVFPSNSEVPASAIPFHFVQHGDVGGYPYPLTGHQPPTSPYGLQPGWPVGTPINRGTPLVHNHRDGAQYGTVSSEPWNQLMHQMTGSQ